MNRKPATAAFARPRHAVRLERAALHIDVTWRYREQWSAKNLLARVGRLAAEAEGFSRGHISIAIVGNDEMARLHRRHLGIAGPTDVLTFDEGSTAPGRAKGAVILGEIVASADVAAAECGRRAAASPRLRKGPRHASCKTEYVGPIWRGTRHINRAAIAELALYVVHGVLHLAGYDDRRRTDFERMHRREDELLLKAGIGRVFAPA